MKKIIITISILLSVTFLKACPFCGCGTGNYYIGLLPTFSKHFIGVRYQYTSFRTSVKEDPSQFSHDRFQSVELWGGWNIGKRWQLMAIVPFNFIHQTSDDAITNNNGIGDIAAIANYKVFSKVSPLGAKKRITQQFWLGAGVKVPTGKFSADQTDEALVAIANTQAGTGSTDFLINGMYNININNFGVTSGVRYKINTTNNDRYYFGDKLSANSLAYYAINRKETTFTPNAGFTFEHNNANKLANEKISVTGGYLFCAAAGMEMNMKKVTVGFNAQLPLKQNFSDHQTETKVKGMVHVTFSI